MQFLLLRFEMFKDGFAGRPDRSLHFEICLLRQIPDSDSAGAGYCSRGGFVSADEDSHERGLADPIWPDDGHARAFDDREGYPAENISGAV
jgi:hypothetical protein